MPIRFLTTKTLPVIDKILREKLGYNLGPVVELEKQTELYDQLLVYVRGGDEVKVHQKYSGEKDINELVPLAKRILEYEGSLPGLGELWEKKLDE